VYISDRADVVNQSKKLGGRYQLVEYTFTNNAQGTAPMVDYDFSAVDSLNTISLAVEAIGSTKGETFGWVGMPSSIEKLQLQSKIDTFSLQTGWPKFTGNESKIPSGYNLFALTLDSDLPQAKANLLRQRLISRWLYWYDTSSSEICFNNPHGRSFSECKAFADSVKAVMNAFKQNANENGVHNPSDADLIKHIIGYVNFAPDGKNWAYLTHDIGSKVIGLLRGVADKNDGILHKKYLFPAYDSNYNLNPYVTFIHGQKALNLQVYAFSIDDSIGNIQVKDFRGMQIDVGGTKQLPDTRHYTRPKEPLDSKYHIIPGGGWGVTTGVICGLKQTYKPGEPALAALFNNANECNVTLTNPDTTFSLRKMTSGALRLENCHGAVCDNITVNQTSVNLPGGSSKPVNTDYHIYVGAGWGLTTGFACQQPVSYQLGKPAIDILFNRNKSCFVTLYSPGVSFNLNRDQNGNLVSSNCKNKGQADICSMIHFGDKNINLPGAPA
ncbi:hypothetical protein, partial [Fangia hongkongensis]